MWDSGLGTCVACGLEGDRDILGRCPDCFRAQVPVRLPYFKEMGVENPMDPKGSTAHVREIKTRRIDPKTKAVFNYEPPKTYFFPKETL
jgi:hypothetical protein